MMTRMMDDDLSDGVLPRSPSKEDVQCPDHEVYFYRWISGSHFRVWCRVATSSKIDGA